MLAGDQNALWAFGGGPARGLKLSKSVIAAINGHVLAGELEMALACDIRPCSPYATFSLAELKWGIIPGGGTQRPMRTVAPTHALEMLYTGDAIDAIRAERIGLVSAVVAQEKLCPKGRNWRNVLRRRGLFAPQIRASPISSTGSSWG